MARNVSVNTFQCVGCSTLNACIHIYVVAIYINRDKYMSDGAIMRLVKAVSCGGLCHQFSVYIYSLGLCVVSYSAYAW